MLTKGKISNTKKVKVKVSVGVIHITSNFNTMNYRNIFLAAFVIFSMSCEEVINVDLENASPVLVVDAWINSNSENPLVYFERKYFGLEGIN